MTALGFTLPPDAGEKITLGKWDESKNSSSTLNSTEIWIRI